MGGRLRQFHSEWEKRGSYRLITGLRQIQVALQGMPKPIQGTLHNHQLHRLRQKKNALWTSIQYLLQKGAVEVVHTPESLGFYSRLFLVLKPGNRWRAVTDLSSLNQFLAIPKFKMEIPESIRASLRKGEWVTSIDLTDAYLHVPIHSQSQKYLRFHFRRHLLVHQPLIQDSNSPPPPFSPV